MRSKKLPRGSSGHAVAVDVKALSELAAERQLAFTKIVFTQIVTL